MMTDDRRFPLLCQIAFAVSLVSCVAALGWMVGQHLPRSWRTSSVVNHVDTSDELPRPEATLAEQMDAVRRGSSATIKIETRPLEHRDVERLAELKSLQVLLLDHADNEIGDDDCRALAELPGLIHLCVRGGTIGDAGLAQLSKLPQLKILNLPHSRTSDQGLAILAAMPQLAQLRLGTPRITDAGMKELSRFPHLRQLHLIGAPITDAGLEEIARLPRLESLYLDDSRVSDEGLERLFRARPELHVHINQQHHDRDPKRGHAANAE